MFDTTLISTPVWNTEKVIGETIMMHRNPDGTACASLLFVPEEIISVTDLSGTVSYEEGKDWEFRDGKIHLLPGTRIDSITDEELYPAVHEEGKSFPKPGGYSLWTQGALMVVRQIHVTYTCKNGQWTGVRPTSAKALLPRTFQALENKQPLTILLNGDSISAASQVSKTLNIPPYQPGYGPMLIQSLEARYGCSINYVNTSVGGKDTNWAVENIEENINVHNPDLVIIAFGMNDGRKTPEEFEERIRTMIKLIREKHPLVEFILVATSLPNPVLTSPEAPFWGNQQYFLGNLNAIAEDPAMGGGIVVANISDMHRYLLSKKSFQDLTSNNVNHPNDFFYRCYAQFLYGMLEG